MTPITVSLESLDDCAEALRAARRARGLTQSELARLSGLGLHTVSQTELGRAGVKLDTILRLSRALGLTLRLEAFEASCDVADESAPGYGDLGFDGDDG